MKEQLNAGLFLLLALIAATFSIGAHAEENGGGAKGVRDKETLDRGRGQLPERSQALSERMRQRVSKLTPESRKALQQMRLTGHLNRDRVTRVWLKRHWGETLRLREAQDELRVHARRAARLHRIVALAKDLGKEQVVLRAEIALEKEQQRHQRHMAELQAILPKPNDAPSSAISGSAGAPPMPTTVSSVSGSGGADPVKAGGSQ